MRIFTLILSSILILATWTWALAQEDDDAKPNPVILTDDQDEYPLGLYLDILEDASGELTIDDVSSLEFDPLFVPSQDEVPIFGFTDSAYWVRLDVHNESSAGERWLLEQSFPNMHFVDLYVPLPDGDSFDVRQTGVMRPLETRDIIHPHIVFDLSMPPASQETLYLRFQNEASMTLPLTLWEPDAFSSGTQQNQALQWIYFGILIGLIFYNLFLLFSLRERNYLYLVSFLAAIILYDFSYSGYAGLYFFPDSPAIKTLYDAVTFPLIFASMVLFADSFLELGIRSPRFHRVNIAIVGIWGVLMLLIPFLGYQELIYLMAPWAMVSISSVIVAGIISLRSGFRSARYFMIAWLGLLVGIFLVVLVRWNIIPSAFYNEQGFRLGIIWLAIMWSIALADRINVLKAETEGAERRLSQILEGLPIGVAVYGKDQKPSYINQRTIDILANPAQGIGPDLSAGRTLDQAVDHYTFRVAGTDQAYPIEKIPVYRALEGEASSVDDLEADLVDKRVPLEVWGSPVKDDGGNIESAVVAFQDITSRKRKDAELAEYRENLEHLVEERTAELRAVEGVLRRHIEWLSAFQEVSQTSGGSAYLPQAYEMLSTRILELTGAGIVIVLYWGEGGPLETVCRRQGEEPCCEVKKLSAAIEYDLPLRDEIERGGILSIPADQAASLPAPLGEAFRDTDSESLLIVPMFVRDLLLGVLGLAMSQPNQEVTRPQLDLVKEMAHDLAGLSEDAHLLDQARDLLVVKERNRLARELHDSVTQTLFTASVLAEATPLMWEKNPDMARNDSERISVLLRGALAEMRALLLELRSDESYNQSLSQLLAALVEAVRSQSRAEITVSITGEPEPPKNVGLAFYRIAREALNNVVNHAAATQVTISLLQESDQVKLCIGDDGMGFDPNAVPEGHLGLNIMTERAAQIGGDLQIKSRPDHGTEIVVTWSGEKGNSGKHE